MSGKNYEKCEICGAPRPADKMKEHVEAAHSGKLTDFQGGAGIED